MKKLSLIIGGAILVACLVDMLATYRAYEEERAIVREFMRSHGDHGYATE